MLLFNIYLKLTTIHLLSIISFKIIIHRFFKISLHTFQNVFCCLFSGICRKCHIPYVLLLPLKLLFFFIPNLIYLSILVYFQLSYFYLFTYFTLQDLFPLQSKSLYRLASEISNINNNNNNNNPTII